MNHLDVLRASLMLDAEIVRYQRVLSKCQK
ncbi:hypothetical protein [Desulforamulus ferrireducens]